MFAYTFLVSSGLRESKPITFGVPKIEDVNKCGKKNFRNSEIRNSETAI